MTEDKQKSKKEFKRRLYNFTLNTIGFLDKLPRDNVSKRIGDQLLRSVTSVIGNYIEAGAASSKKDYANYFNISLKSANESKLWFSLLKDTKRGKVEDISNFIDELNQISNIFASSLLTMKNKK